MRLYFIEDLASDLLEYYERYKTRSVEEDKLILWIYRKHKGQVSIATIIRKLRTAKRKHLISIMDKKFDFGGYKLHTDTIVVINPYMCKGLLLTTQTITLLNYMGR